MNPSNNHKQYTSIIHLSLLVTALVIQSEAKSQDVVVTNGVQFEPAGQPIPYEPHTLEDADGKPLPKNATAVLQLDSAQQKELTDEFASAKADMELNGFSVEGDLDATRFRKQLTAGEYTAQMNSAEKLLNSEGKTLRSGTISAAQSQVIDGAKINDQVASAREVYEHADAPTVQEKKSALESKFEKMKADADAYKDKLKDLKKEDLYVEGTKAKCEPEKGAKVSTENVSCFVDELKAPSTKSAPLIDPKRDLCKADTPFGNAVLANENWNDSGGDESFGWVGTANFSVVTDANGLTASANAEAQGLLMNKTKKMVDGNMKFNSPHTGKPSGNIHLDVFGQVLINRKDAWDVDLISSRNKEGEERYMHYKDLSIVSTTFVLGFVPVTLNIDGQVSSGPSYDLDLAPVKVVGKAEWQSAVKIIASAGIGADLELFTILAGVKGYVDLINIQIGAYPEAGFYLNAEQRPEIGARLAALAAMSTLSGKLTAGVWAKTTFSVPHKKSGFPFVEMKPLRYEWSKVLGDYPGYKFPTATLFDKTIGYDVCSGRKTQTVLIANQPRDREIRKSYELLELDRVTQLETKLISLLDDKLYSPEVDSVATQTKPYLDRMHLLSSLAKETSDLLLSETL